MRPSVRILQLAETLIMAGNFSLVGLLSLSRYVRLTSARYTPNVGCSAENKTQILMLIVNQ